MDDTRNSLTIGNSSFTSAKIAIAPGGKVTWANRDDIPHTVTDGAERNTFKSPPLDIGDTFSVAFPTPGAYHHFCSLHLHMQETVVAK